MCPMRGHDLQLRSVRGHLYQRTCSTCGLEDIRLPPVRHHDDALRSVLPCAHQLLPMPVLRPALRPPLLLLLWMEVLPVYHARATHQGEAEGSH